ncbi:MAG: patatin-like phospholipase family protein [Burkholderiaceae bacterium]
MPAPALQDVSSPMVSLVIGSGSVKCAAAIGVARVLAEAGIGIERVIGCSGGAIFATLIATGHDADAAREATVRLWTSEITARRNARAMLSALAPRLMRFSASRFGLRDDRQINHRLAEAFGETRIEDTAIPLHITATDFGSGDLVELSSGSVARAIRASLAIPFAFSPVEIDGRLLVDGYVSDPLPISVAIRHGARVIVAVGFESPTMENIGSAGRFAMQLSSIMSNNLLRARFAFNSVAHHAEVITVLPEFGQRIRLFDTAKLPDIIEAGARAAGEQIGYLQRLLAAQPTRQGAGQ